jgi:hypothetical protein
MAKKDTSPVEKQQQLEEERKKSDQTGPYGKQPHEIAERTNMKRQKQKMHEQDNK